MGVWMRAALALGVGAAGYWLTDLFFRFKKIPYPSEGFGILSGIGFFCGAMAVLSFSKRGANQRRNSR